MDADLLADMATFAAVVDCNGFSKASETLNMSKSSVSRRVAALEARLGTKLMHRTTRSMTLSESGRLYYDYCARLVNDAKDADAAVKLMRAVPSGELSLSVPEALGRASILPLLPEFLRLYPDIRLNLVITSRKVDLEEERIDVAVRKGEIEDEGLMSVPLGSSTQYLYASPDYLASASALQTPQDTAKHHFLASRIATGPTTVAFWKGLKKTEVQVEPRVSVKDHEALVSLTVAGLGVAFLPVWMAARHEKTGALRRLLPEFRGPSVDFNIVYRPGRGFSPTVRSFVEFLTEKLDEGATSQRFRETVSSSLRDSVTT